MILVLLDLSAAFDTVDHNILLSCMSKQIGVSGTALEWCKSYLSDRYQSVFVNNVSSSTKQLEYGVPQGSIIGPLEFIIYSSPIASIARKHGIIVHLYADDTQLYLTFEVKDPTSLEEAMRKIEVYVAEVK